MADGVAPLPHPETTRHYTRSVVFSEAESDFSHLDAAQLQRQIEFLHLEIECYRSQLVGTGVASV